MYINFGKTKGKTRKNHKSNNVIDLEHQKFGFGKIVSIDTNGNEKKAKVNFDNFGEKTLLLSFAKLMVHED